MTQPNVPFPWPYLTAESPGIGGRIKIRDEDFVVSEIPLYEASGKGTHTYFTIEKQGLTTAAAIREIARLLEVRSNNIGYAGLKDAHGITRQMLSLEHTSPDKIRALEIDRIRVLSISKHTNKLKLGHLKGNHFEIRIRNCPPGSLNRARSIADQILSKGLPNYFGPQRFGARGDNARIGEAALSGDFETAIAIILGKPSKADRPDAYRARELFDQGRFEEAAATWPQVLRDQVRITKEYVKCGHNAKSAWRAVDHSLRRLFVSALQSELFNHVLARRIDSLGKLYQGDVAWIHRNGAAFLVEDPDVEQPRADAFEISPSGPLFGKKMKTPEGEPAQIESQVLEKSSVPPQELNNPRGLKVEGLRRPLRIPLQDLALDQGKDEHGDFIRVDFSLPPGCYATCLTREICKTDDSSTTR